MTASDESLRQLMERLAGGRAVGGIVLIEEQDTQLWAR
jgi:hypothetical protein